jgi:hypothetical protein
MCTFKGMYMGIFSGIFASFCSPSSSSSEHVVLFSSYERLAVFLFASYRALFFPLHGQNLDGALSLVGYLVD